MPSTNKTPNLGLSQYIGTDKPTYLQDYNEDMLNIDSKTLGKEFIDTSGAVNYIGKNIGTLSIDTGTHIFTNCTGTINYSGSSAKVYLTNSPSLILNSKTALNWKNISVDGIVSYHSNNVLDIPFFIAGFTTGDSILQLDPKNIANFNDFIGFVEFADNAYTVSLDIDIKDDATIIMRGDNPSFMSLVYPKRIGIALKLIYNSTGEVVQIHGDNLFALGTIANNLPGKRIRIDCI